MTPKSSTNALPVNPDPSAEVLDRDSLDRIAEIFKAFSDGTRLAILQALKTGERTTSDLVAELGTTPANISRHLKILHDARLLSRRKDGMQVFYGISDEIVFTLCQEVCGKLNRHSGESTGRGEYDFSI